MSIVDIMKYLSYYQQVVEKIKAIEKGNDEDFVIKFRVKKKLVTLNGTVEK